MRVAARFAVTDKSDTVIPSVDSVTTNPKDPGTAWHLHQSATSGGPTSERWLLFDNHLPPC